MERRKLLGFAIASLISYPSLGLAKRFTGRERTEGPAGPLPAEKGARRAGPDVPLYRVFEKSVTNSNPYSNKFTDVTLNTTFFSPSQVQTSFSGFYDGDGLGGQTGNVWKIRFMPNELGLWTYSYSWSDTSPRGSGSFHCIVAGAGKGVIRAYRNNPRWFAHNGTDPVFIRSYYIITGGFLGVDINWAARNVYQQIVDRGYTHVQIQSLPIAYTEQVFKDAPAGLTGFMWEDPPSATLRLDWWKSMEDHVRWLNDRDIGFHGFQGFDGRGGALGAPRWQSLSKSEKDFLVRYVCSRLASFANVIGWNYTWETAGDGPELELMDLLSLYDVVAHLRTYEDALPAINNYSDARYTFAAIENHGYFGQTRGKPALDTASHHQATLDAYACKPVYMTEGNGLWRSYWGASETTIPRCAWGTVTAGGSFTWNDILDAGDPGGPASSSDIFQWQAKDRLDTLYDIMEQDVSFYDMDPSDGLLSNFTGPTYCLAEVGNQYVVYKENGGSFDLEVAVGAYSATWVDVFTGNRQSGGTTIGDGGSVSFSTPNTNTDWVLLLVLATRSSCLR